MAAPTDTEEQYFEEAECEENEIDAQVLNLINKDEIEEYKLAFTQQLEEFEMLEAIFYKPGEFVIDSKAFNEIKEFIHGNGQNNALPDAQHFTVNLVLDGKKVGVHIRVPRSYPITPVKPEILISSDLSRHQHKQIMNDMNKYLYSFEEEPCLVPAISWLQSNFENYFAPIKEVDIKKQPNIGGLPDLFTRYWIYSHHIYDKTKRDKMAHLSQVYNLTGFCLLGKPGIICLEGYEVDCENWWAEIRSLCWQKIGCKLSEGWPVSSVERCNALRQFGKFQEISFVSKGNSHTDMGEFYRYLKDHRCGYIFRDLFGFQGKVSSSN